MAIMNAKGGVGKTTLAANLGLVFASFEGSAFKKILLVDMDPQHNLSQIILGQEELNRLQTEKKSLSQVFEPIGAGGIDFSENFSEILPRHDVETPNVYDIAWHGQNERLVGDFYLVCGHVNMAKFTLRQDPARFQDCKDRFFGFMADARRSFDLVILDCNPSFSAITECALEGCTVMLSPVTPDSFALRGLTALRSIASAAYRGVEPKQLVLMNMTKGDAPSSTEETIRGHIRYSDACLNARVPKSNYMGLPGENTAVGNPLDSLAYYRHGNWAAEIHQALEAVVIELSDRLKSDRHF